MPGVKRSTEGLAPVPRERIEALVARARERWPGWRGLHHAALIALTYLSGRRASEVLGLTRQQVEVRLAEELLVLRQVRILKRFKKDKKTGKKSPIFADIEVPLRREDPLAQVVLEYLAWHDRSPSRIAKRLRAEGRLWAIRTRQRFWQIMVELDPGTWPHWLRHMRASHLAAVLDTWEHYDYFKWGKLETARKYVHRRASLEKIRQAGL